MTTITVAGERLTAAQQRALIYAASQEFAAARISPGRGEGLMFWKLAHRGLFERVDTHGKPLYRITTHGKGVAAAVQAYRREMDGGK